MSKHALVEQPGVAPTAKITAAGVGAAAATVILSLADLSHVVDLPTFWDTLLTGLSAFAAGYMKKARTNELEG